MKKLTFALFIAFWASAGTIAALAALDGGESTEAESDPAASEATYTLAEVAEHASLDDCWMAIEGVVYDFTDYVPAHPTPPTVLAPWCGREATEGMRTKGYGRDHSEAAWTLAERYRIGRLAE
ncbi:cytochrome b5 domain-containing protein [Wenzhouxiangella marina]|uniref:Putative Ectothiorhodospira Vacuolata Cytochrome n=1 Tax=Wenzhouxiangella marina TaxID=1579979 RepID=A0A0K0XU17_9GAMM|nr:cytochrome b5-like heme/steroid binding domain-containing protein [Wenzhouxiangella marina]AKS41160.1 putative Ectothiorhodospira Vacuolata Cytochrome [Wenzhouxiangella marina]MBB6088039.1 cytochrome b involved in lipid metabolism [Wenzhouxiangella marina]